MNDNHETLKELEYYCSLDNPVGALMLSGGWGCGKTFLIDKIFKPSVTDKYTIIRISLFGIDTVDKLSNEVKRAWIYEKGGLFSTIDKAKNGGSKISNIFSGLASLAGLKDLADGIFSIDPLSFVKIENTIDNKKVILVFDDLERSNLETLELVGVLNDYCENQHFNIILIANEEKVKKRNSEQLSYDEIKEKLVQRTILYQPNFNSIIASIIEENRDTDKEYCQFLVSNKDMVSSLFLGRDPNGQPIDKTVEEKLSVISLDSNTKKDEVKREKEILKKRQYNLRALKAAFQDFKRLYDILKLYDGINIDKWFFSFLSCELVIRSGIPETEKTSISYVAGLLYSGYYDSSSSPDLITNWIETGVWNDKAIRTLIEFHAEQDRARTPGELVRTHEIDHLSENTVNEGFPELVSLAYQGELSLNEYVGLIQNCAIARMCGFDLPCDIKWSRVEEGIQTRIKQMVAQGADREYYRLTISDRDKYSPSELSAYDLINEIREKDTLTFEKNKQLYLELIAVDPNEAFLKCRNLLYCAFDEDMARATFSAFDNSDNSIRADFPNEFYRMWRFYRSNRNNQDSITITENALQLMKTLLYTFLDEHDKEAFARYHCKEFIQVIDSLLEPN